MLRKELINDPRLTPTMKRTRDGNTQLFREPNIDRDSTNNENAVQRTRWSVDTETPIFTQDKTYLLNLIPTN